MKRVKLPEDWDPATDMRLTVWETMQHLVRTLQNQGREGSCHAAEQARRPGRDGPRAGLSPLFDLRTQEVGGRGPGV